MLEREPLTAATIVTSTTSYGDSVGARWQTGSTECDRR